MRLTTSWFAATRPLVRLAMSLCALLLVSSCGAHVVPKAVAGIGPIECSVTIDFKLSCSVGRQWMVGLGPVKVGLGFDIGPASDGDLTLVIKQPDGTAEAWKVG